MATPAGALALSAALVWWEAVLALAAGQAYAAQTGALVGLALAEAFTVLRAMT